MIFLQENFNLEIQPMAHCSLNKHNLVQNLTTYSSQYEHKSGKLSVTHSLIIINPTLPIVLENALQSTRFHCPVRLPQLYISNY